MHLSQKNYSGDEISIPLVANPELDVFKAYRAYDDFEDLPLHGTFLVDAEGRIRWQDISYDPFMDIDFLLSESKRLLSQSSLRQQERSVQVKQRLATTGTRPQSSNK